MFRAGRACGAHTDRVPELPEVEAARTALERAVGRTVARVDDRDEWVCRPHRPGEIASVLEGGRLTAAHRIGKTLWCDTATAAGSGTTTTDDAGPALGLHLGMGGRIVVTDPAGEPVGEGPVPADRRPDAARWTRFTVTFDDGGELRLVDKRRLGRVRLDPDLSGLGPDAEGIAPAEFRDRLARGRSTVKARLLDQSVIAGVGNLLADETLWQARIDPRRRVPDLTRTDLDRVHHHLGRALARAVAHGGVHTGEVIEHRRPGGHCPRCGAELAHGTVGGRSTWWCPREQT